MTIDETLTALADLLALEEAEAPIAGIEDLLSHQERRSTILQHLQQLDTQIRPFRERVKHLPEIPPLATIRRAQTLLAMPNLVFLELDTTGLFSDADIIQVVLLERDGQVLLDLYVQPAQLLAVTESIQNFTGITIEQLENAPTLATVIEHLRSALVGKYLISYNLGFDQTKLREATKRLHGEDVFFIGEDLMGLAMEYFGLSSYPKLSDLCAHVGHPLPEQPHQTAIDRALGQRTLLMAMADAITGTPKAAVVVADDGEDDFDEDHPF